MKVYGNLISPYVQRVLLAARFKGHELLVEAPPGGRMQSAEFAEISPMRRIPILADRDLRICESSAIIAHLDEVLPGPALLPADPAGRARARSIAHIAESELGGGLRPFVMIGFGTKVEPAVLAMASAQAARGLDAIERLIDLRGPWAVGAEPGIADAALVPLLLLAEIVEQLPGIAPFMAGRSGIIAYRERALAHAEGQRVKRELAGLRDLMAARRMQQAQQQQQQQ